MRRWLLFLIAGCLQLLLFFPASAHETGVFAGTHIVEMEAHPHSPFVGENIEFLFRIKDLRGQFPQEPVVVAVEIKEALTESVLFNTSAATVTDGRFRMAYAFPREGEFSVSFNFWSPENPEATRDANFPMQVRKMPQTPFWYFGATFLAGIAMGLAMTKIFKKSFRLWIGAIAVILFTFTVSAPNAAAVFSTVVNPNGLPPPDKQCLEVGASYTIKITSDANHVALYYRTDGQQPTHLDSSEIRHPLQIPKSTTTATWAWPVTSAHISETGRIWVDGHDNNHDSFNTWDSSNDDFAVRTSCAKVTVPRELLIAPTNFDISPELANFEATTSTTRYRYSTQYSGTFRLLFYDAPYTTFLLQSREADIKPGELVAFTETGLLPNTFYLGNREMQAYHRHGFWSALSAPSSPFWTSIERPEKIAVADLTPTSVTLRVLNLISNLGKGNSGILFENITASTTSGWVATTTLTFAGLEPDTTYQFWAKARNGGGVETDFGGLVTLKTPVLPREVEPSSSPSPSPTATSTPLAAASEEKTLSPETIEILLQEARDRLTVIAQGIAALQKQRGIYQEPFRRFTQSLVIGSQGPEVVSLQQVLSRSPEIYPEGLITGYFGPLTERAVKRLQKKYGIEPLGIVGPKTRAILETL